MVRIATLFAILFSLVACGPKPDTGAIRIDPALETLVPADTVFLMGADVDAIRKTAVYQKHEGILNVPALNDFVHKTGVDPRKDLSQLLWVFNGKTGVLMVRGKFNVSDLESRLEHQGSKRVSYKGHTLFGDQDSALLFLNSTTAVGGNTTELKSIVDNLDQPRHGLPPALAQRARTIPGGSQIWAAFIGGVAALNGPIPDNTTLANIVRIMQGIDNGILSIDVRNGFNLLVEVLCKNEAAAKQIVALLKAAIGFGRLSTPDNQPDLLKLYDAIKVEQVQSRVTATVNVPAEMVEQFITLWTKRRK